MSIKKTKELILSKLIGLPTIQPENLYLSYLINWGGYIKNTWIKHTELVIKQLYKEKFIENGKIKGVKEITCDKSYCNQPFKNLLIKKLKECNDFKVNFIENLLNNNFLEKEIGVPIEYYVAIDKQNSGSLKIDLITYKAKTSEIFLIDITPPSDNVTALKCCMKIQTCYQELNKEKLINDFYEAKLIPRKDIKIKTGIIVFENSKPFYDYYHSRNSYLKKLIKDFKIKVCIVGRTKNSILKEFRNYIKEYNRNFLYYQNLMFYQNFKTYDTNELYSEVIAKDLLDNNFYMDKYNPEDDFCDGLEIINYNKKFVYNNSQKIPELKKYECFLLGKDYSVNQPRDVEVPLLAYDKKTNEIFFVEEISKNTDITTLSHCIEIQELTLRTNYQKIVKHLHENKKLPSENYKDYKFKPCLLVFKGSKAYKDLQDETMRHLNKVVKELGIKIICV